MSQNRIKKAILFDRDGVVIKLRTERGLKEVAIHPNEVELIDGAAEFIRSFKEQGWLTIIVSNQPDVAKGKTTLSELEATKQEMIKQLAYKGVVLDEIYYCLHHPNENKVVRKEYLLDCDCRKPKPGLLLQAAKDFGINLTNSWMIGDRFIDIQAGKRAGCKTILFKPAGSDPGNLKEGEVVDPDIVSSSFLEIYNQIIRIIK